MNYNKLTELIEDTLNNDNNLFDIKFLNNNEAFNPNNLIYDDMIHGVVNLVSTTPNTIQLQQGTSTTNNRTDVYNINIIIPLNLQDLVLAENLIDNFLNNFNNQTIELEDTTFFTTGTSIVTWSKLSNPIDGVYYELITIQFSAVIYENFLFGNERSLTINNEILDCVVDVTLQSHKQFNGLVFKDGIFKNQNNGLQYALIVDFIYNKNSSLHKKIIADWQLNSSYSITYKIGGLNFSRTCVIGEFTLVDITGDVVKIRISFVESV